MASISMLKNKIKIVEVPVKEQGMWIFANTECKVDKNANFTWNSLFQAFQDKEFQIMLQNDVSTKVLTTTLCSPDLMMFLYTSLLSSVLTSSCNNIRKYLSWNAWNSEFQVKVTFLSTLHFVSAKILVPCSLIGSSTVFLFFFITKRRHIDLE